MDDMLTMHPGLPCRLASMPSRGRKACVTDHAVTAITPLYLRVPATMTKQQSPAANGKAEVLLAMF